MNNQSVEQVLDDCTSDLTSAISIISSLGRTSNVVSYLNKYAIIKACGTIEVAFKSVFNITPLSINTVTLKGKTKTNWQTRAYIKKSDRKKAIISVPKGTKIELLKLNTK